MRNPNLPLTIEARASPISPRALRGERNVFAALDGASGSVIAEYVDSSYFWICTTLSRMPLRSALISYGGGTLVGGVVCMVVVYILWAVGLI